MPMMFMNPWRCQIISAGRDKQFGPGGTYWRSRTNGYSTNQTGSDDFSNFLQIAALNISAN